MAISCDYASPDNELTVNYHFDADTMTIYPADHPAVVAFVEGGGSIGMWHAPPPPDTSVQDRRNAFKADANYIAMLAALKSATPAQVQTFITTNVTDLPSARAMLVKLALIVAILANGNS